MFDIIQVESEEFNSILRALFSEYLEWVLLKCEEEFKVSYDVNELVREAVENLQLDNFLPPSGRLYLVKNNDIFIGTACLRKIGDKIGEVKRMYVSPIFRGKGLGRSLLNKLIEEGKKCGYTKLRLDSGPFMKEAQGNYRSVGFNEIRPYPESEVLGQNIPEEISQNWIFMELSLEAIQG
jgi:ribosomal protein S18 acetylase RimI-like enzyme